MILCALRKRFCEHFHSGSSIATRRPACFLARPAFPRVHDPGAARPRETLNRHRAALALQRGAVEGRGDSGSQVAAVRRQCAGTVAGLQPSGTGTASESFKASRQQGLKPHSHVDGPGGAVPQARNSPVWPALLRLPPRAPLAPTTSLAADETHIPQTPQSRLTVGEEACTSSVRRNTRAPRPPRPRRALRAGWQPPGWRPPRLRPGRRDPAFSSC